MDFCYLNRLLSLLIAEIEERPVLIFSVQALYSGAFSTGFPAGIDDDTLRRLGGRHLRRARNAAGVDNEDYLSTVSS